jgi:hypothetical protein
VSPKRILLLCGSGYSSDAVYTGLVTLGVDVEVILESGPSRWRNFRRRVKRHGLWVALGQLAFRLVAVPWLRFATRRRVKEIRSGLPSATPVTSLNPHRVSSANSPDVRRLVAQLRPDLVVVNGTRILSPELLAAINAPTINMHAGITPLYRGVHGGYWALVDQRPELFGTTVHRVDPGVDTGEVLGRAFAAPTDDDTFASYPYLQIEAGLPVLLRVAEAELGLGKPDPVASLELPSVQRYHPSLCRYLGARWRLGVK